MDENPKMRFQMDETLEVLLFGAALVKAVESSMEDKKLNLMDLPNFIPVFTTLMPALSDISEVAVELQAASPEDIEKLKASVRESIDLKDEQFEDFTEKVFAIALDIYELVKAYGKMVDDKESAQESEESPL